MAKNAPDAIFVNHRKFSIIDPPLKFPSTQTEILQASLVRQDLNDLLKDSQKRHYIISMLHHVLIAGDLAFCQKLLGFDILG